MTYFAAPESAGMGCGAFNRIKDVQVSMLGSFFVSAQTVKVNINPASKQPATTVCIFFHYPRTGNVDFNHG
jgi:hypothetical protein